MLILDGVRCLPQLTIRSLVSWAAEGGIILASKDSGLCDGLGRAMPPRHTLTSLLAGAGTWAALMKIGTIKRAVQFACVVGRAVAKCAMAAAAITVAITKAAMHTLTSCEGKRVECERTHHAPNTAAEATPLSPSTAAAAAPGPHRKPLPRTHRNRPGTEPPRARGSPRTHPWLMRLNGKCVGGRRTGPRKHAAEPKPVATWVGS